MITGGEPTLHPELPSFVADIKQMGYAVKLDTNGSHPEVVAHLINTSSIDYCAMDIKAPLNKYPLLCGVSVDTETIMRTIAVIHSSGLPHHFRTTLYPPMLSEEDMSAVKRMVPKKAHHLFQPYLKPGNN